MALSVHAGPEKVWGGLCAGSEGDAPSTRSSESCDARL